MLAPGTRLGDLPQEGGIRLILKQLYLSSMGGRVALNAGEGV